MKLSLQHRWQLVYLNYYQTKKVIFVSGPFEKFMQVTMILPLTGQQYSEKVSENCVAIWKSLGIYTEEEGKAIDKFVSIFKDETFPPGSSILFTVSPKGSGSLSVSTVKISSLVYYLFCIIPYCFLIVLFLIGNR